MQIKARLHTLEFLCDNSVLVMSTDQVKRLWACLGPGLATASAAAAAAETATLEEVSTLLSWLSKACEAVAGEGGEGMFAPGVAAELFEVGRGERSGAG